MTRTPDSIHDEWLVLRCQSGEVNALSELLSRWRDRFVERAHTLLRHDADAADAAQDAMIAIARSIHRLNDPALFAAWANRIVANKCADLIETRQRSRRVAHAVPPPPESTDEHGETHNDDEQTVRLRLAIDGLPLDLQAILVMRHSREMSTHEIAAALGIREGTVKSRLHHARNELKASLERLTS